jgi:lysophospholipase L1-like esterase
MKPTNTRPWIQWAGMWLVLVGTWGAVDAIWPEAPWSQTGNETLQPLRPRVLKPTPMRWGSDNAKVMVLGGAASHGATEFLDSLPDNLPEAWRIQGPTAAWYALGRFLNLLPEADGRRVEVYHWGDSQIEGDRITGELRDSWQRRWGGHGPGWVLPKTPAPSLATVESTTGSIERQAGFGLGRDREALRLPFFALNAVPDSASWTVRGNSALSPFLTGWTATEVWSTEPRGIRLSSETAPGSWVATTTAERRSCWNHEPVEGKLRLEFETTDLQGVFLGSDRGVLVHNLPMRGSSGTLFDKVPAEDWELLKAHHPPDLVVLQFGGNAVPGIATAAEARGYARRLGQNIELLRQTFPGVPVLVIGPSDMGKTPEDYPGLQRVIAALQSEVHQAGGLYWDLQAAMGGVGSMTDWVQQGWAGNDHIHLTRRGAREVGRRLEAALHHEWRAMSRPLSNVYPVSP